MVRRLLEQTRSRADRGFEWYYWQRQLHRETRIFRGHGGAVHCVAFSPDGRNLITSGEDGVILIRDVATGVVQRRMDDAHLVSVSADGERLLCLGFVDKSLRILSAKTGARLLGPLPGLHPTFSPDGRKIVAGGWFDHGLLWEAATPGQVTAWEAEEAAGATQWQTLTEEFRKRLKAEGRAAYEASRARRAAMEQATAEKLALLGDLSRFARDPGAIRQWLVLSPPPGFFGGPIQLDEEQLPDEAGLRPRAHELTRPDNQDRVWVPLHLEDYRLDFRKNLKGTYPCGPSHATWARSISVRGSPSVHQFMTTLS